MYAMYLRKSRQDMELELLGQGETLARHRETLMNLARKTCTPSGKSMRKSFPAKPSVPGRK